MDQAILALSSSSERGAGKGEIVMNGKRCAYQGHKAEMKRREARHSC